MNKRRDVLKGSFVLGSIVGALPSNWSKPIVNSIILPAHAQTSGFTTESINESISLEVTATEIRGPIIILRSTANSFNGVQSQVVGQCRGVDSLVLTVSFNGSIDSANNQITGNINLVQRCGAQLVCEQVSTFTVIQIPLNLNTDIGVYTGSLIGTLRCLDGFGII